MLSSWRVYGALLVSGLLAVLGVVVITASGNRGLSGKTVDAVSPAALSNVLSVPGVEQLDGGEQERDQAIADRAGPSAVQDRLLSRTRYEHLSDRTVERVLSETVPSVLSRSHSGLGDLPAGTHVSRYSGARTARLDLPGGKHAIVASTAPVATLTASGAWAPVNLSLRETGQGFVADNAAVPVNIPRSLAGGARLDSSGVSVTPVDAQGTPLYGSGRIDGGAVVYPNTATDTDTAAKPTASGMEVYNTLRSIASPRQLSYDIGLPEGASLVAGGPGHDMVKVVDAGQTLSVIPPASAVDAAGTPVPVSTTVSGHILTLRVDSRSGDYRYPIVVDPTVVDASIIAKSNWHCDSTARVGCNESLPGFLFLSVEPFHHQGEFAALLYPTQGESHIYGLWSESEAAMGGVNVDLRMGMFNQAGWEEPTVLPTSFGRSAVGACVALCSPSAGTAHNLAAFRVAALSEEANDGQFFAYAASVYIAQSNGPTIAPDTAHEKVDGERTNAIYGAGSWLGPYSGAVEFDMTDPGVGVHEVEYKIAGGEKWTNNPSCAGPVQCPEVVDQPLVYWSGPRIPDGEPTLEARDTNAIGLSASSSVKLKVDGTAPTEIKIVPAASAIGESDRAATIVASAKDGSGTTLSSGIGSLKLAIDDREVGSPSGGCSPGPCSSTGEWTINAEDYAAGTHTVTVTATDVAGNSASSQTTLTVHHASTVSLGPGKVNPVTGEFDLKDQDVSMAAADVLLTVSRSYDSRDLSAGAEGPLGGAWSLNVAGAQEIKKQSNGNVLLVSANGAESVFRANGEHYESPPNDSTVKLTYSASSSEFVLASAGSTVTFAKTASGPSNVWMPVATQGAGGIPANTYAFETVAGITRPTEELAPVPAGVSCSGTLKRGCRALTFNYATSTTATGPSSSGWGDYTGRLTRVYFTAYDPSLKEMTTSTVAQYAYDTQGRLRAEWDPRVTPAQKIEYGYDAGGHVTAISPPGESTWAFTYGTTAADASAGRILKVTQAPASASLWGGEIVADLKVPQLSGSAVVGHRMAVSDGAWTHSPVVYGYQWQDCNVAGLECQAIAGADNANYTPTSADVGHELVARVTATNGGGSVSQPSAASSVVATTPPYATQSVDAGNALDAVACVSGTTACVVSDGKGNAYYATNVSTSGASWSSWTGPGVSPSEALACPTTSLCLMAAGGSSGGGSIYYATSLGGSWTQGSAPVAGYDAISCGSSSLCVGAQPGIGEFRFATNPTSTSWTREKPGTAPMTGVTCVSSSFCMIVDGTGLAYVATSTAQVESASWIHSTIDSEGLNGVACVSSSACVAVDSSGTVVSMAVSESGAVTATKHKIDGTNKLTAVSCAASSACVAVDNQGNVFVSTNAGETWNATYQLTGKLTSASCPSSTLCAIVDDTGHVTILNPTGGGIVEGEARAPQPGFAIEYGIPVSGSGAPYPMSIGAVAKWAQVEIPTEATAVLPPETPSGWPASGYTQATVYYLDKSDRLVNEAHAGGGISTAEYNSTNDVVRTLTPDNREAALKEAAKSAEVSQTLDTQSTYGSEGTELLSRLEPLHTVKLANGSQVQAREHTVYSYDENAPAGGPYRLVTKVTRGAQIAGEPEVDVRTTTMAYAGQNNLGWLLRVPTATKVDPGSLKLTHTTVYDPSTGNVTETRTPGAGAPNEEIPSGYVYNTSFGSAGAVNGKFSTPRAIARDGEGDIWVADTANNRVEEFSAGGSFIRTFGMAGTAEGQLKSPEGIAIDGEGHVWVSDTGNNRVEEFSGTGTYLRYYGSTSTLKSPSGIAYSAQAKCLYIVDTGDDKVKMINIWGGSLGEFGSAGTAPGALSSPRGVAVDSSGHVWVVDSENNRVEQFGESGAYISQFGSYGSANGKLYGPHGIAVDSKGNLLVADTYNDRIEGFSLAGAYLYKFGARGSGTGQLSSPYGVVLDSSNNAFVLDTENDRIEKWVPAGSQHESSGTGGAYGRQTIYYTVGANSQVAACGERPEWANLVCEVRPAAQPETSGVPNLPVTTYTYNVLDDPSAIVETVGAATRTTENTYDGAGRILTHSIASTAGMALPTVKYEYNPETGYLVKQSATIEGATKALEAVFNRRGEVTSYTDADGNTATYTYDPYGRIEKISDAKGSQTYGYEPTTGRLASLTDSAAGTFTYSYDPDGNETIDGYPNGMNAVYTYDAAGEETGVEYVKTTHCASKCTWYSETIVPSIQGQALSQTSTLSTQSYSYDSAGRLTKAQDTPSGSGCTTRIYAYDAETNRQSLTTAPPGTGGACASEGGTAENHAYDTGNRLADAGIVYEAFGNITKLPASDAGGSEVLSSYYSDNALAGQSQKGETIGYNLDPGGRPRVTVSAGEVNSTVTSHYDDQSSAPAWTEDTGGNWTRNVTDANGRLVATQANSEAPVLQIEDLHGSIVATASLSETATELLSTKDTTEYGVPRGTNRSKYSWLGSTRVATEFPSGIIAMGARSYVPQIGRFLQTDPIPGGSANAYAYTFGDPVNSSDISGAFTVEVPGWVREFLTHDAEEAVRAAEEAAQRAAEEQAAREEAEEKAGEASEETVESFWSGGGKGKKAKGKPSGKVNPNLALMTDGGGFKGKDCKRPFSFKCGESGDPEEPKARPKSKPKSGCPKMEASYRPADKAFELSSGLYYGDSRAKNVSCGSDGGDPTLPCPFSFCTGGAGDVMEAWRQWPGEPNRKPNEQPPAPPRQGIHAIRA